MYSIRTWCSSCSVENDLHTKWFAYEPNYFSAVGQVCMLHMYISHTHTPYALPGFSLVTLIWKNLAQQGSPTPGPRPSISPRPFWEPDRASGGQMCTAPFAQACKTIPSASHHHWSTEPERLGIAEVEHVGGCKIHMLQQAVCMWISHHKLNMGGCVTESSW